MYADNENISNTIISGGVAARTNPVLTIISTLPAYQMSVVLCNLHAISGAGGETIAKAITICNKIEADFVIIGGDMNTGELAGINERLASYKWDSFKPKVIGYDKAEHDLLLSQQSGNLLDWFCIGVNKNHAAKEGGTIQNIRAYANEEDVAQFTASFIKKRIDSIHGKIATGKSLELNKYDRLNRYKNMLVQYKKVIGECDHTNKVINWIDNLNANPSNPIILSKFDALANRNFAKVEDSLSDHIPVYLIFEWAKKA